MDGKPPVYIERILALCAEEDPPLKPGVYHVDVYHDDWCASWQGGKCNCDPVVFRGDETTPAVDNERMVK